MPLIMSNIFIYSGLVVLSIFFLAGITDFSVTANILNVETLDTRLIVMFLLAEPHFAMTIPLLYSYRKNFRDKPIFFFYIPILIVFGSVYFVFRYSQPLFFIFLIANVYHVNRQSVGFLKLQARYGLFLSKLYEILLHAMTFACLYVALFRKAHGIDVALIFFTLAISIMFFASWYNNKKPPSAREFSVMAQGFLNFFTNSDI